MWAWDSEGNVVGTLTLAACPSLTPAPAAHPGLCVFNHAQRLLLNLAIQSTEAQQELRLLTQRAEWHILDIGCEWDVCRWATPAELTECSTPLGMGSAAPVPEPFFFSQPCPSAAEEQVQLNVVLSASHHILLCFASHCSWRSPQLGNLPCRLQCCRDWGTTSPCALAQRWAVTEAEFCCTHVTRSSREAGDVALTHHVLRQSSLFQLLCVLLSRREKMAPSCGH